MKFFVKIFLFVLVLVYPQLDGMAQDDHIIFKKAGIMIDNGGYAIEKDDQLLLSHNFYGMYIPASIVKTATALTALQVLGTDYRFETHFHVDSADNLYIKGFGDPFLVSEEVSLIMDRLQQLGVHTINNIFIDHSSYQLSSPTDGLAYSDNPYQVSRGADADPAVDAAVGQE
jgi:D-alanyl-D-alanine carboxypeptidase/D-alanyl-D-alanine-endopeptidase (penicillin-binding protein 4)